MWNGDNMQSETADNGKCYGFDNDSVLTENDQFQDEVAKLKEENRLLVADFDTQRAKMKELFLLQESKLLFKNLQFFSFI